MPVCLNSLARHLHWHTAVLHNNLSAKPIYMLLSQLSSVDLLGRYVNYERHTV